MTASLPSEIKPEQFANHLVRTGLISLKKWILKNIMNSPSITKWKIKFTSLWSKNLKWRHIKEMHHLERKFISFRTWSIDIPNIQILSGQRSETLQIYS
jgi:hypothetical protein